MPLNAKISETLMVGDNEKVDLALCYVFDFRTKQGSNSTRILLLGKSFQRNGSVASKNINLFLGREYKE